MGLGNSSAGGPGVDGLNCYGAGLPCEKFIFLALDTNGGFIYDS